MMINLMKGTNLMDAFLLFFDFILHALIDPTNQSTFDMEKRIKLRKIGFLIILVTVLITVIFGLAIKY